MKARLRDRKSSLDADLRRPDASLDEEEIARRVRIQSMVSRRKAAPEATRWRASLRNKKPDWRSDGETTRRGRPAAPVDVKSSAKGH